MEKTVHDIGLLDKAEWFINIVFGGRHHCKKVEDKVNHVLVVPNSNHSFATFDGDKLTKIVMASHQLCLRAEVEANGMHGLRIMLHNRAAREGRLWERHPDIETMIEKFPPLTLDS